MRLPSVLLFALIAGCTPRPGEPVLREIEPAVLLSDVGGLIVLHGEGFLPGGTFDFDRPRDSPLITSVSAELEQADQRVALGEVTWVDSRRIDAKVPVGLAPGLWTVHLVTPRGAKLALIDGLLVEALLPDGGLPDGGELDGGEPDGGVDAGPQPCDTLTLEDLDGDGFGVPDSGALLCGPGRTLFTGDCNDVDPLTSPAGIEVCNALDDNCEGTIDEGCADAGFNRLAANAGGADFLSTSAWGPDQLWIAGGSTLLVHDGDAGFINSSANCPVRMNSVWAAPSGMAFVAGGNNGVGRIATARRGVGCSPDQNLPEPVAGMVGFPLADGGSQVVAVLRDGRRASWNGVSQVQVIDSRVPGNFELFDAHGSAPEALYAVGGTNTQPQRPAVFRLQADGGFISEALPTQNVPDGQLHGVWVLSPTEVVAVGDRGMVLRRVQGVWERIAPPSNANYTTVRAFSIGRFYLSTEFGYLRQWSGQWTLRYTDQLPVRDLTAFDEQNFWLVGDNGLVISGP